MILQALYQYYQRKSADPENTDMAPPGWQWKEIPFVLVLDAAGTLVAIDDRRSEKKNRANAFLVPQEVTRTVGVASNILWDKPSYLWGYDPAGKPERLRQQQEMFLQTLHSLPQDDAAIGAAIRYFSDPAAALLQAQRYAEWAVIAETMPFIGVRFDADAVNCLIGERTAVKAAIDARQSSATPMSVCLVTGERMPLARLHDPVKGIPGAQTSGARIVSFNLDAFRSYGKQSGDNAPVGEQAMSAYVKALNHLLGKDSKQKIQCGNSTVVFWARKDDALETTLAGFLGFHTDKDDPDAGVRAVEALLNSPHSGGGAHFTAEDRFYLLGLSPNAARVSIRFWLPTTVAQMKRRLCDYAGQIRLSGGKTPYPPLRSLLSSLALEYKLEHLSPLLEGQVLQSIFSGQAFPQTLLPAALQRARAEQAMPHLRAALIKAVLIRNHHQEISMSLDETNPNAAYHLGRLFAVLEKLQEEALPGLNATILDRYFAGASTRPATVFPTLMKLHVHHLGKLENRGRATNLERMVTGIVGRISCYAPRLSLEDQGLFSIGYYHQRQALFAKAETPHSESSEKHAA